MVRVESETEAGTGAVLAAGLSSDVASSGLLVVLSSLSPEGLEKMLASIAEAFPGRSVLVATPDNPEAAQHGNVTVVPYTPASPARAGWVLTAADYVNAYLLAQQQGARGCLLLGPESQTLQPSAIAAMSAAVLSGQADLVTPRYDLSAREGLVNSAILYPVSCALYGARSRFPLALDVALSLRMAERLAAVGQRSTAAGLNDGLVWPVAEAALAGYATTEVPVGRRVLPQPPSTDLNTVLAQIAGSLFADLEAKASFWQRARVLSPSSSHAPDAADEAASALPDINPMLTAFRVAYTNLHEIWSLVLPPQSLLGLKKLSLMPAESFRMPDALWARTVYDFVLAYRLRTLNRGHLLGALTPLYLAWVASHILQIGNGDGSERHIDRVAIAFEADKPYLVSRWRWPDRFNP